MNTQEQAVEQEENLADDEIAHFKALRDHYEKAALRAAFENRQLAKANQRLQLKIAELEKQLIPAAKEGKVITIDANSKKEA